MAHETDETDEKLLDALKHGGRTPGWLIDNLDLPMSTSSAVGHRLKIMSAAGLVENIGHGIYELPGGYVPAGSVPEPRPEPEPEPEPAHAREDETAEESVNNINSILSECEQHWKRSNSDDKVRQMKNAARVALETLRDDGLMSASDFKDELADEYPVDGQNEGTWWKKTIRPALTEAEDEGLVEYSHGTHVYEWV